MRLGLTWRQKLGDPECPYMERWALSLGRSGPSLRLHRWFRSDDKRYKHDHPASFITLVLKGSYTDLSMEYDVAVDVGYWREKQERMTPGKIAYRKAEHIHTVAVDPGGCWTLCFFFPDRRRWGFFVKRQDGTFRWKKSNKFFLEHGHHPCDQP